MSMNSVTAQEWLKTYDSQLGGFFATDYEKYAADIIREQQEQIDRLRERFFKADALAAARLIELNDIRDREASKVAGVCYQIACGCAYGYTAAKKNP